MKTPIISEAAGVGGDYSAKNHAANVQREIARIHEKVSSASFLDMMGMDAASATSDSFQNFMLNLGPGTDNSLFTGSTYGFNPITRVRTLLEWIHRGSWLGGVAVDLVADDMTKGGVDITTPLSSQEEEDIDNVMIEAQVWNALNDTIKWSRLYGGALAVILVDGHDLATPLRLWTIGRDGFKGLAVFDRWMLEPDLSSKGTINEPGPYLGQPRFYKVNSLAHAMNGQIIHHSRCLRFEGVRLPFWQRVMENSWGISVLERLYDRMIAFDAATIGAAQLVHKSYLRTFKIKGLRGIASEEGELLRQLVQYVEVMRRYQGQEGMTLLDAEDDFQIETRQGFAGIDTALMQFGQQLAGALQIPLVRLFGMSPAGFSATGESDLRTYYDGINQRQERDMRVGLTKVYRCIAQSLSIRLNRNFGFVFRPLWQLTEPEKAAIANSVTSTVNQSFELGLIDRKQALLEYRSLARRTGVWSTITEDDVEEAALEPPPGFGGEMGGQQQQLGGEGGTGNPQLEAPPKFPQLPKPPGAEAVSGAKPRLKLLDDHQDDWPVERQRLINIRGLPVYIENWRGEKRGEQYRRPLAADYGYIRMTGSTEGPGEGLDCFVGPNRAADDVWVISQVDPMTDNFDEYKVLLAFDSRQAALDAYRASYDDDAALRIGEIHKMTTEDFRRWLQTGGWQGEKRFAA